MMVPTNRKYNLFLFYYFIIFHKIVILLIFKDIIYPCIIYLYTERDRGREKEQSYKM